MKKWIVEIVSLFVLVATVIANIWFLSIDIYGFDYTADARYNRVSAATWTLSIKDDNCTVTLAVNPNSDKFENIAEVTKSGNFTFLEEQDVSGIKLTNDTVEINGQNVSVSNKFYSCDGCTHILVNAKEVDGYKKGYRCDVCKNHVCDDCAAQGITKCSDCNERICSEHAQDKLEAHSVNRGGKEYACDNTKWCEIKKEYDKYTQGAYNASNDVGYGPRSDTSIPYERTYCDKCVEQYEARLKCTECFKKLQGKPSPKTCTQCESWYCPECEGFEHWICQSCGHVFKENRTDSNEVADVIYPAVCRTCGENESVKDLYVLNFDSSDSAIVLSKESNFKFKILYASENIYADYLQADFLANTTFFKCKTAIGIQVLFSVLTFASALVIVVSVIKKVKKKLNPEEQAFVDYDKDNESDSE